MDNKNLNISNKNVAYNGALLIVASVFGYSLLVMIYVIIRSSITIYSSMPHGEKIAILWNNGISVAYSIAVFSIIMASISIVIGSISALILKNVLHYFNSKFKNEKAILISFITAILLIISIYLLLSVLLKDWMTFNYIEPFLFWFIFPATIFLAVFDYGGNKLNNALSRMNNKSKNETK